MVIVTMVTMVIIKSPQSTVLLGNCFRYGLILLLLYRVFYHMTCELYDLPYNLALYQITVTLPCRISYHINLTRYLLSQKIIRHLNIKRHLKSYKHLSSDKLQNLERYVTIVT